MKKIILDVDTGIDDSLAIAYAVHSPELQLLGITTCFGNVSVEEATRNTLVVLEHLDSTVPVIPGAGKPFAREPIKKKAVHIHGEDGIGNTLTLEPNTQAQRDQAVNFMIQQVNKQPGEVTLIMVGPLTNLALALKQEPELVSRVERVVIMGGAVTVRGNVTPHAEANIYADPDAAEAVFRSGIPITLVGLDVTMKTLLPLEEVVKWREKGTKLADLLADMTEFYIGAYKSIYPSIKGCALHDPLAVAAVTDPSFVKTVPMRLSVELQDTESLGHIEGVQLDGSGEEQSVDVCIEVDAERFLEHFLSRVIL
ncbi:nucleoside hydrolase [Paenibacillus tuaregi]|uniref:nucleoside hydrolase n=1 Tax=Paenibacillus tuaregi TaxID=1816681 RepID=UPI00083886BD|nr:nucleoside hydrolase [Paenibacillus tuaregi]